LTKIGEARLKWLRDEECALMKAHLDGKLEGISEVAKKMLLAGIDPELVNKITAQAPKEQ
jgi:hypothetical protein